MKINKDNTHAVILHYEDGSVKVHYFDGESPAERFWFDHAKYRAKIDKVASGLVVKLESQVTQDWEMHRWNNQFYEQS
jgi:hypothetical protein